MKWYLCHECGNVWQADENTCPACGNHKNVWDITDMKKYKYLIERAEKTGERMKLARYLADCLEHELESSRCVDMQEIIQQGIEAFESTEDVKVLITNEESNLLDAANEILSDFNQYGEVLQQGDNGEYGLTSPIGRLVTAIVDVEKRIK